MATESKSMFRLRRPCANCPFRTDVPPYLRGGRAAQIAQDIALGSIFSCHKTVDYDRPEEDFEPGAWVPGDGEQFCAGALIAMVRGEEPNQAVRMAERMGLLDIDALDLDAPVVGSLAEFVRHHADQSEREDGLDECCAIVNPGCEAPAGMLVGGSVIPSDNSDAELHTCPACGETVCDSCSDEDGVCAFCGAPCEGQS
jgi:hypothetical protein